MKGGERREGWGEETEEDGAFVSGGFRFLPLFLLLFDGRFCPSLSLQLGGRLGARCESETLEEGGERVTHDMRLLACCHASMHGLHAGRTGSS